MMPYISTTFGDVSTFPIFVAIGILALFLILIILLRKHPNKDNEENYIFPKIVISGLVGYFTAGIFDALFKWQLYGEFKITGITFYGGLIGASISLFLLLKITKTKTLLSIKEWFDMLTIPFIVFHVLGRLGCFFGGCCYGKTTASILGVYFPDNVEQNIFHNGLKCFPTQLFEVVALLIILFVILNNKDRFESYILYYSIARFVIEFFRGDVRGYITNIFSPAQIISIILFIIVLLYKCLKHIKAVKLYNCQKIESSYYDNSETKIN